MSLVLVTTTSRYSHRVNLFDRLDNRSCFVARCGSVRFGPHGHIHGRRDSDCCGSFATLCRVTMTRRGSQLRHSCVLGKLARGWVRGLIAEEQAKRSSVRDAKRGGSGRGCGRSICGRGDRSCGSFIRRRICRRADRLVSRLHSGTVAVLTSNPFVRHADDGFGGDSNGRGLYRRFRRVHDAREDSNRAGFTA
jgi:hypothetical protein